MNELEAAADSEETNLRFFAVNALGAAVTVNDQAVFALTRALSDANSKVATAAAIHLSRTAGAERRYAPDDRTLDPEDFSSMPAEVGARIYELSNSNPHVRRLAAIRLSLAGSAALHAVPALTTALGDADPVTRLHAAQAIWEIERNGYAILPVLVDQLLTEIRPIRGSAPRIPWAGWARPPETPSPG